MTDPTDTLDLRLFGEGDWIAVDELCRVCRIDLAIMTELVELGFVSPRGPGPQDWLVPAEALPRLQVAARLIRDLGVNTSGAVIAVELLEVQRRLERRLRELEQLIDLRTDVELP